MRRLTFDVHERGDAKEARKGLLQVISPPDKLIKSQSIRIDKVDYDYWRLIGDTGRELEAPKQVATDKSTSTASTNKLEVLQRKYEVGERDWKICGLAD